MNNDNFTKKVIIHIVSCELMFYIGRMTTGARTAIFWILLLIEKPSAPRISYGNQKSEERKENVYGCRSR
jgi:hypothetical protein